MTSDLSSSRLASTMLCRRPCPGRSISTHPFVSKMSNGQSPLRIRQVKSCSMIESKSEKEPENEFTKSVMPKWIQILKNTTHQDWTTFMELARIHNFLPSCLLVFVGALKSVHFSVHVLYSLRIWAIALVAGGVAVASVIVNDYFDFIAGIDSINEPTKPLPSGLIRPDTALLITLLLYVAVLVAGCVMEPPLLRWIIAFSAASTLIYTPLLKSLTLIKNFVVASVITLSPVAGALAAGTGVAGIQMVQNAAAFIFGAIVFREILMDIDDVEGDALANVHTLPVVLGKLPSLILALVFLTLGSFVGGSGLWSGQGFQYLNKMIPSTHALWAVMSPYGLLVIWMFQSAFLIWKNNYSMEVLENAVSKALVQAGFGFLLIVVFG